MFAFFRFVRESLAILLDRSEDILRMLAYPPLPGGEEFEPYFVSKEFTDEIIRKFQKKIVVVDGMIGVCEGAGNIINTIFTLDGETTVIRHYVMLNIKNDLKMVMIESIEDIKPI